MRLILSFHVKVRSRSNIYKEAKVSLDYPAGAAVGVPGDSDEVIVGIFKLDSRFKGESELPEENLIKIFEPLYTTKQRGTGLGLSIAKHIIQAHHGDISVNSALEKGTSFLFTLPKA